MAKVWFCEKPVPLGPKRLADGGNRPRPAGNSVSRMNMKGIKKKNDRNDIAFQPALPSILQQQGGQLDLMKDGECVTQQSVAAAGMGAHRTNVDILPAADVLDTLVATVPVSAVVLDPWYNKGIGGCRADYDEWLADVVRAACRVSDHVFVWGFPEILAHQLASIPPGFSLLAWLTWYYKNCPSVIRGWRSAQNTCLHIAADHATVYPEHFLNDEQRDRWRNGKMRFVPGPPSVLESPLNIGFVGRSEQTGHPAQKPLAVIEPLLLMATKEDDTVLDPMCGSGTTGEACLRLNRNAILCDSSPDYLAVTRSRIAKCRRSNGE